MKKYLLINPFGIGDVLFSTPVAQAIRDADPSNTVSYWCNERVQELFAQDPNIDSLFALSRGDLKRIYAESAFEGIRRSWELFFRIKKARFDVAVDFSLDHRYSLVTLLAGIKKRVGFDYRGRGGFLTDRIRIDGYQGRHMAEYYLDLLKLLGIPAPKNVRLRLYVSDTAHAKAQHILSRLNALDANVLIGIAGGAGASWGKDAGLKQWPAVKFAQLADRIAKELNATVLLLGSESERSIADVITRMTQARLVDLVGKTSIKELAAIMSYLKVLVTNDGGPLHMAAALGVRTVSIFGPVDSRVYGPYPPGEDHIVIQRDLPCRPCYQNFRMPVCKQERECISSIETQEVFEAVRRLCA